MIFISNKTVSRSRGWNGKKAVAFSHMPQHMDDIFNYTQALVFSISRVWVRVLVLTLAIIGSPFLVNRKGLGPMLCVMHSVKGHLREGRSPRCFWCGCTAPLHVAMWLKWVLWFEYNWPLARTSHAATVPRPPCWWAIGLHRNSASPKMRTSLTDTQCDIAHQYGASKINLMMTSGELDQYL